ncbi:hypothetical protein Bca4012_103816 [Brassica carinata]
MGETDGEQVREVKMKRTLKRESRVLEIVGRKRMGAAMRRSDASGAIRSARSGGVAALLSHPTESSSKWAIFGKQNWRCGMNRKPGYGAQLRANLEPTKGVGRLRQQGGGHGSRNPLRTCPPWKRLSGGRVQRLEEHRRVAWCRCIPAALENPEDRVRSRPVVLITHQVSKVNSLWSMEQCRQGSRQNGSVTGKGLALRAGLEDPSSNPSTVGGLLELLARRGGASRVGRGGLGTALGSFLGVEQPTQN